MQNLRQSRRCSTAELPCGSVTPPAEAGPYGAAIKVCVGNGRKKGPYLGFAIGYRVCRAPAERLLAAGPAKQTAPSSTGRAKQSHGDW